MSLFASAGLALAAILALTGAGAASATDADGLQRHDHLASFQAAAAGRGIGELQLEDFEDSFARFLPDSEFAACVEPVGSHSSDACFEPGGLVDGFTLNSSHLWGVIVLGTDILDTSSLVAGAWPYRLLPSSLNYTRLDFDDGPTFVAVDVYGFRITSGTPNGDTAPVLVEAFDTDGVLISSFSVEPGAYNEPAFVGFNSPVPLGQVQIGTREEAAGAMIDNLHFGGGPGRLQLSPDRLRFGPVGVDAVELLPVEVTNAGHLDVEVGQLPDPAPPFLRDSDDCSGTTLAPGASCTVWFALSPDHADRYRQSLDLPVAAPSQGAVLHLSGTGVVAGGTR